MTGVARPRGARRPAVLAALACGVLAGANGTTGPRPQDPAVAYGVGEGAAARLAAELCASCHGDGFAGGRASSLLDETWSFGGSDADLATSIRDGRPAEGMPPFAAALDEQQIRSLVVLVRELAEAARLEPSAATAVPWDAVRAGEAHAFRLETVADGLDTPWGLEFLPDGRMLVSERPGRIVRLVPAAPGPASAS